MTLKLSFNEPFPYSKRHDIITAFKQLGLSYERIIQNGQFSIHRFYGRLPTVKGSSDIDIKTISIDDDLLNTFHDVTFVEIFIQIERKN